jgi:hypothetical protein
LRARGVMSFHASSAVTLAISALRRSPGSSCTTPPGTRGLLTVPRYRPSAIATAVARCTLSDDPARDESPLGCAQFDDRRHQRHRCIDAELSAPDDAASGMLV